MSSPASGWRPRWFVAAVFVESSRLPPFERPDVSVACFDRVATNASHKKRAEWKINHFRDLRFGPLHLLPS